MVFLGSLLYILAYLATDIAYTFADPRVRLSYTAGVSFRARARNLGTRRIEISHCGSG